MEKTDAGVTQRKDPWHEGQDPWKPKAKQTGADAKAPESQKPDQSYGPAGRKVKADESQSTNSQGVPMSFGRLEKGLETPKPTDPSSSDPSGSTQPHPSGQTPLSPQQMQEAMMAFLQMCLNTTEVSKLQTQVRTRPKEEEAKKEGRRKKSRSCERKESRGRRRKKSEDEEDRRRRRREKDKDERERRPPKKSKDRDDDPGDESSEDDDEEEGSEEEEDFEDDEEIDSRRRTKKKKDRRKRNSSGGGSTDPSSSLSRSSRTDSAARTSEVRSMLRKKVRQGTDRPRSSIGSVKIEEFYGDRARYRKWKTAVQAQEVLYRLEEEELSMLIYLSTKKDARDVMDQQPISEFTRPGGIKLVWKLLDEAFGETEEELFERAEVEFNTYRRIPGQSMATPQSIMSDRAWAQRLLNRSSLARRERLDVFFSAGGKYQSKEIEVALRHRCGRVHEDERRLPVPAQGKGYVRPVGRKATPAKGGKGFRKGEKKTFYEDAGNEEEEQEEDLEEDEEAFGTYLEQQDQEEARGDLDPIDEEEEDQEYEEESLGEEELKEAWAAGWKAKSQQNEKKKYRGWKGSGKGSSNTTGSGAAPDKRKTNSTCSSCGEVGHWKGDAQCRNVQNGQDKPHRKKENGTHVSTTTTEGANVHFTYVVTTTTMKKVKTEREEKKPEERKCHNPECRSLIQKTDKFCSACGIRAPMDESMREKRGWDVIDVEGGASIEVESSGESESKKKEASYAIRRAVALEAAGIPTKIERSR